MSDLILTSTGELTQVSDRLATLSREIDTNANAYLAIESYVSGFMGQVSAENWNYEKSRQYNRGFTGILRGLGLGLPIDFAAASFEAVSVTQTKEENRDESKKKATGVLKAIWDKLSSTFTEYVETAANFSARIKASGASVTAASVKLSEMLEAANGDAPAGGTITGKSWGTYLLLGAQEQSAIRAISVVRTSALTAAQLWVDAFDKTCTAVGNSIAKNTPIKPANVWPGLDRIKTLQQSWPGGVKMTLENVPEGELTVALMAKTRIKLVAEKAAADQTLALLNRSTCVSLINEMKKLGDALTKSETQMSKFTADVKSLSSMLATASKNEGGDKALVTALPQLIDAALSGPQVIYPYAAKVAQGAYKHIEASIKQYK